MRYLVPTLLVMILPTFAKAVDDCPNMTSAGACMECADEEYWDKVQEIRAQAKKDKEAGSEDPFKTATEILKHGEHLKNKERECEKIGLPKRNKKK